FQSSTKMLNSNLRTTLQKPRTPSSRSTCSSWTSHTSRRCLKLRVRHDLQSSHPNVGRHELERSELFRATVIATKLWHFTEITSKIGNRKKKMMMVGEGGISLPPQLA
ncbi:hypothetical protein L914_16056, partial [Phytophthora nicotianae]